MCHVSQFSPLTDPEPTRPGHVALLACKTRFGLDQSINPPPDDGLITTTMPTPPGRWQTSTTTRAGAMRRSRNSRRPCLPRSRRTALVSEKARSQGGRTNTTVTVTNLDLHSRYICMYVCLYVRMYVCIIILPQGPAHDDTTCAGVIFLREILRCSLSLSCSSTHTQQGPRIRSRETAAPWVINLSAPNIFFRVCVCVCVCAPQAPNATTGRRNNNSRNRVSTKSLSASHPCAGPSLREASPRPQAAGPQE